MYGSNSNICSAKTLTEAEHRLLFEPYISSLRFKREKKKTVKRKKEEGVDAMCLLEFTACDDLPSFRREIEEKSLEIDEPGFLYCRHVGSKKMGFEERTALMVAAMYGSIDVLNYIITTRKSDVNRVSGNEKVTALHSAVSGCFVAIVEVIKILLHASASPNCVDANGNKPVDLLVRASRFVINQRFTKGSKKMTKQLL